VTSYPRRFLGLERRAYALIGVTAAVVYFALPAGPVQGAWYTVMGLLGAAGIALGVAVNRPRRRLPWLLLAASLASSMLGDAVYTLDEQIGTDVVPFPGPADALYLAAYPLAAAGLWLFVRQPGRSARGPLLDSGIITVAGALLLWRFVIARYLDEPTSSAMAQAVSSAYVLADLLVLAFALHLLMSDRRGGSALRWLIAGTFGLLGADVAYAFMSLEGTYVSGDWVDVGWVLQYLCWGAAALDPSMKRFAEPAAVEAAPRRARLLVLVPFGLVAPLLELTSGHTMNDAAAVAVAEAALFLLLVARMSDLVGSLMRSLEERGRLSDALRTQAQTDPLTGLPNRTVFAMAVEQAVQRGGVLVAFCDLDDFKSVNDSHGHAVGDELLTAVAGRLRRCLDRPAELVARLGGDEFGVLVADGGGPEAAGRRLLAVFDEPFELSVGKVRASASIGLAHAEIGGSHAGLLPDADVAMYMAKREGKARVALFDPEHRERVLGYPRTVVALREAIDRGELVTRYQPVVDLRDGRMVALEALVRWDRPGVGLLPASEFLPAAEASDLVADLDAVVLRRALSDLRRWRMTAPNLRVSVNLAGGSLRSGQLSKTVREALREAELEPGVLTLEITERALVEDRVGARIELEHLSASGVTIALDDFGTGHSSLLYLHDFPVDVLKLDRRFVTKAGAGEGASALLRGTIRLAQTLGLQIVAEGVENTTQWGALRRIGCQLGQGYLFAAALEPGEVDALLARDPSPVLGELTEETRAQAA
jgi:diguanylate cyclase (GGDEF)-like protein